VTPGAGGQEIKSNSDTTKRGRMGVYNFLVQGSKDSRGKQQAIDQERRGETYFSAERGSDVGHEMRGEEGGKALTGDEKGSS